MADTRIASEIAGELSLRQDQVARVLDLLDEQCTIPFIARYRKEATGSLDETVITRIRDLGEQIATREDRRKVILESIAAQGKLDAALEAAIRKAHTLGELEDLYLPYRPKRKTRASMAREKGLEPLAQAIWEGSAARLEELAVRYAGGESGVADAAEALAGARDILAEQFSEEPRLRGTMRDFVQREGRLASSLSKAGKDKAEAAHYQDYHDYHEPLQKAPSHRILAVLRGAEQGILKTGVECDKDRALARCEETLLAPWLKKRPQPACQAQVREALADAWSRLLEPSLETECLKTLKERADLEAIQIFSKNLREMLLESPFGSKAILALDPGFRTGCKLAVITAAGTLADHGVIYPLEPQKREAESEKAVRRAVTTYRLEAVALGNGTGGRELEAWLRTLDLGIPVVMVNEAGASIYSASEIAREEFPDLDLTVRSAVSIGRRLIDPLAELVKIDPKSIGVGQYQHDVDQKALKRSLDETVASCVNNVGVDLNTASPWLLSYVSGLSPRLAKAVVGWRASHGAFRNRKQLLEVSGLGPKAFQQCAGFLRIRGGDEVLDQSAVHPEHYEVARRMAKSTGLALPEMIGNQKVLGSLALEQFATGEVGLPTLKDIVAELGKPGRDPRSEFTLFSFTQGVNTMADLSLDMVLPGVVQNVAAFGAFVDIGVHVNGLVHISEMADRFVKDPHEILKPGQKVRVRVKEIDMARKRIGLSMKNLPL